MSESVGSDPDMDLAELCLDAADQAEAHFERLSQRADEAPTPKLREILARAAAAEMVFANRMRADADDLMFDYDDGFCCSFSRRSGLARTPYCGARETAKACPAERTRSRDVSSRRR
jgi:hypothetical protein